MQVAWVFVIGSIQDSISNQILYASFKYGDKEEVRKDRLFNDYTESTFTALIKKMPALKFIKQWKTADVRPKRKGEYWYNVLLRKES